jgi:hypothetical protein
MDNNNTYPRRAMKDWEIVRDLGKLEHALDAVPFDQQTDEDMDLIAAAARAWLEHVREQSGGLRDLVGYERRLHRMSRADLINECNRWGVDRTSHPAYNTKTGMISQIMKAMTNSESNNFGQDPDLTPEQQAEVVAGLLRRYDAADAATKARVRKNVDDMLEEMEGDK